METESASNDTQTTTYVKKTNIYRYNNNMNPVSVSESWPPSICVSFHTFEGFFSFFID